MKLYGLIGFPLKHSFSQEYFTQKFIDENITNTEYRQFEMDKISKLPELIKMYPDLLGLNITIPYKKSVIPFLQHIEIAALQIGSVNTLKIKRTESSTEVTGYNTDIIGFEKLLEGIDLQKIKSVIILGNGGSSAMVQFFFRTKKIETIVISRKPGKDILTYNRLNKQLFTSVNMIINTTPLGMFPNIEETAPLPYALAHQDQIAIDLIYNPSETLFLKKFRKKGAHTINGLKMLHEQAEKSWHIWNE